MKIGELFMDQGGDDRRYFLNRNFRICSLKRHKWGGISWNRCRAEFESEISAGEWIPTGEYAPNEFLDFEE